MCSFFGLVSDGLGEIKYFDWEQRQKIASGEILDESGIYEPDNCCSICDYYKIKESEWNNYEYNPLTEIFTVNVINTHDDSEIVERKVRALDFKTIVEPLIVKHIVNPFKLPKVDKITEEHIKLLKEWRSVCDSVGNSVSSSVWNSERNSVWGSVWKSVWNSAGSSVWKLIRSSAGHSEWDSIWKSISDSVWVSMWKSVWDSVCGSIYGYISSFFNLTKWKGFEDSEDYKNPFQSVIDLWKQGLVPSFDGKTWRIHSGKCGDIVYSVSERELQDI